jgi:23S rRNA (cytosine1962-C5)-methyltransferase
VSASFEIVLETCIDKASNTEHDGARRLFHGRGHCYPGLEYLTVDRFASKLLIGCFGGEPDRVSELGRHLFEVVEGIDGVAVQVRDGRRTRTEVVAGEVPEELVVREAGLSYLVQPLRNQNVGLFLDMAPVRDWVRESSNGRRVLNLFAFTCAFSVAALAGGAAHVVNNDMSRAALDWGQRNHALNGHDPRSVSMLPHNLFKSWWKIRQLGPYDLVIIDPPTNQRGSFNAEKQYGQVLKRLPELCAEGADVVACLNSPFLTADFLTGQMARRAPSARFDAFLPISPDFPDRYPDRALKVGAFRYGR